MFFRSRRAFTLIELAVVVLIIGLMAGGAMMLNRPTVTDCYSMTKEELEDIHSAIARFQRSKGYYPLPASKNLGVNGALFGRAVSDSGDVNIDNVIGGIVIGALPSVTLGLEDRYAADCWGNKFTYVVTTALTDAAGYTAGSGTIIVKTGILNVATEVTSPSNRAAYAVISHGEDGLGATPMNYMGPKKNCNSKQADLSFHHVDKENCDTNNATVFDSGFNNGKSADDYFDDLIIFAGKGN